MTRRTDTPAERAENRAIEESLKTSTYLTDNFWESIHGGAAPSQHVPNYKEASRGGIPSEGQGMSMDMDGFYRQASGGLSDDQMQSAVNGAYPSDGQKTFSEPSRPAAPQASSAHRHTLSRNQAVAVQKYPTLVEFLGRPEGEKIARKISSHMNLIVAESVGANSKEANEEAIACKPEKQNLKQYFQGEDWVCRVTASGPFRGDEAIYYSRAKDVARVLRKSIANKQVKYADVSENFNIIYELGEGEILSAELDTVEASVEQTTSTEGEENVDKNETMDSTAVQEVS